MSDRTVGVCTHCGIVVAVERDRCVGALSGSTGCRRSPTGQHEPHPAGGEQ